MKSLLILGLALATTSTLADTITARVHSIDEGIVRFDNGRVAFLDDKNFNLKTHDFVKAQVDDRSSLLSFTRLPALTHKRLSFLRQETTPPPFEATVVPNMKEALKIFNRSNPHYKRISECSDRAHIWAHNEFKFSGTKSQKVFVFFTASYIDSVRFKWWFHVAPLYKVNDRGTVKDLVMDYRFTDRPMTVKEWTDKFVYTKRSCKETTKFSEYDTNPQTENCYLIFESMHYKIPGEIHDQETLGVYKSTTSESELQMSQNLAFIKK
jgi:hypothetical protein